MIAPAPSPYEQAEIDRSGIFEPEERVEQVARAFHEAYERLAPSFGYETRRESAVPWKDVPEQNRRLMVAVCSEVIAAMPASPATCGDLSPSINFGGDADVERFMCDLPVNHGGAHQHDNGDGLPPMRWIIRAALAPQAGEQR